MKICLDCGDNFPLASFPNKAASKDGKDSRCRECFRTWHRDYYRRSDKRKKDIQANNKRYRLSTKTWVDKMKMAAGCIDCGYNKHPEALQFDHLRDKVHDISLMVRRAYSREAIANEIGKCEIVCANCHAIRTATRRT